MLKQLHKLRVIKKVKFSNSSGIFVKLLHQLNYMVVKDTKLPNPSCKGQAKTTSQIQGCQKSQVPQSLWYCRQARTILKMKGFQRN